MRTVVYQSFRTTNVPPWIGRCLQSVEEWALACGFAYRLIDDRIFDYVPAWYKERVRGHLPPIVDLARLEVARELLSTGYERTVWVDADVLVFQPQAFAIDVTEGYAFCQELCVEQGDGSQANCSRRVNNAVTVFTSSGGHVDFFIHAALSLVRNKPGAVEPWDVSMVFLTNLYSHVYFPLIKTVGLFGPPVLRDVSQGGGPFAALYREQLGHRIGAANLCSSLRNQKVAGVLADDVFFARVVDRLLETRGEVINGASPGGAGATPPEQPGGLAQGPPSSPTPRPAAIRLELGCGRAPTPGYVHHDRRMHAAHVDVAHDLDVLPWPWADGACAEILGLDVFEHLQLMPAQWLRECHRLLEEGGVLRFRVPKFGTPWHLIDPTHVRGFHPENFDYFIAGRDWHSKFGHFYFDFAFKDGRVELQGHNLVVTLWK